MQSSFGNALCTGDTRFALLVRSPTLDVMHEDAHFYAKIGLAETSGEQLFWSNLAAVSGRAFMLLNINCSFEPNIPVLRWADLNSFYVNSVTTRS